MRKDIILLISILLLFIIILVYIRVSRNEDISIYVFDSGKSDAIIISKNDNHMMIDTGEESNVDDILTYFEKNNIRKLDYLIITHFDKDHVGGASKIIDNIDVGRILSSNVPKDSEYYNNYLNSLDKKGIIPMVVTDDYEFSMSSITVYINGPKVLYDKNESNNSSLIIGIEYDNNSFLFMGDAENSRIKDFVAVNNKEYDLIKMPYHGNYLKRLDDLFDDVKPKYAVITSSFEDEKTVNLLNKYEIKYYNTKDGSINILSDGNNIHIFQN